MACVMGMQRCPARPSRSDKGTEGLAAGRVSENCRDAALSRGERQDGTMGSCGCGVVVVRVRSARMGKVHRVFRGASFPNLFQRFGPSLAPAASGPLTT